MRDEERIQQALTSDDPDRRRIAQVGIQLIGTLLKKNADYGSSAWRVPLAAPHLSASDAILVRISDKVARIANLSSGHTPEVQESLEDTIADLAGYAILLLAKPKSETK